MKKGWRRFTVSIICILCLLGFWGYMTIRWDHTVYQQSQLVPVTCTFDSFWIAPHYRGPAAVYIADTNHRYYSVLTDEDQKLRNTLQPGDALEMLVTPRRAIGNPDIAYLKVNGHVYFTYGDYLSIVISGHTLYYVLSFLAFSISAVLIIRIIVLTRRIRTKQKNCEKRTQEKMQRLREAGELHPKKQKSKRKNTPPT
mgnify:FL=1